MIHGTIRMKMPNRSIEEAIAILRSVAERTRAQAGCISYQIYEDAQEEHVIMVEEVWCTQEDLDRHLRSDEYGRVLLVMEMALEAPRIRFDEVSRSSGFETIEKARYRPDLR